jgi:hypothetical protein
MKSRLTLASLAAAVALFAMPTASQAGDLERIGQCMFGWMHHDAAVKGKVHKKKAAKKAKKMKKMAKAPKK